MITAATAVALALATAGPAAPADLGRHVCFVRHDCDRPPLFCLMDDVCDVGVEIVPTARASWR